MKYYLFIAMSLVCISCAPTQFMRKTYKDNELDGKSILVYPIKKSQVTVINYDDYRDDFEDVMAEPDEFFEEELDKVASGYFSEKYKRVNVITLPDSLAENFDSNNSFKVEEKIGNNSFEIRIPKKEFIEKKGVNTRFILVMDQIVFSRNMQTFKQVMPATPANNNGALPVATTSTTKSIYVGINYAIYDYEEAAVVSYGNANGSKSFQFAMTRSDWYASIDDVFSGINKFSPFSK